MDLQHDLSGGAENLLVRCGGLRQGDSVLVVREPAGLGYFDEAIVAGLIQAALDLGLNATLRVEPFKPSPVTPGKALAAAMSTADLTVFLARLGDQVRFNVLPGHVRAIVSYALSAPALGGPFGRLDHQGMLALRNAIDTALLSADEIVVTCPAGTDVRGHISGDGPEPKDTQTIRFPLLVHTPIPAKTFSGRIAQRGFLVGTGSNYYQPYACRLAETLFMFIKDNRICDFSGSPDDVSRAKSHYADVARKFGIEERFVHSWHAGIHPRCAFPEPASASFERWSGSAFGNPRLLHFHTCGAYAPGEVSLNILDPTVSVDGVAVWQAGRLHPERVSGGVEIMRDYPEIRAAFNAPARACGARPGGLSFD